MPPSLAFPEAGFDRGGHLGQEDQRESGVAGVTASAIAAVRSHAPGLVSLPISDATLSPSPAANPAGSAMMTSVTYRSVPLGTLRRATSSVTYSRRTGVAVSHALLLVITFRRSSFCSSVIPDAGASAAGDEVAVRAVAWSMWPWPTGSRQR